MSKRILLVEDEPNMHRLAKATLQFRGFEVLSAFSGYDCISLASNQKLDLIILDVMLQDMDGFEVLRKLKASEISDRIPVAMFTAKDSAWDQKMGKELGAIRYFVKPINPLRFSSEVETLLTELERDCGDRVPEHTDTYENLFEQLKREFVTEFPERLQRLHGKILKKEPSAVEQFGHKLKGSGSSLGFEELSHIGGRIETAAKNGDWEAIANAYDQLRMTFETIEANLSGGFNL